MQPSLRHRLSPIAGVLTLAIGIGFVMSVRAVASLFSDSVTTERPSPIENHPRDFKPATQVETERQPSGPPEFSCYDAHLLPVWHELKRDSSFRTWMAHRSGNLNCSDLIDIKAVDLNQDGSNEFLVWGKDAQMCSGVGNCAFWIFGKRGRRTVSLLSETDFYGEQGELGEQIQRSRTRGYPNILLKGHFSAAETFYTTFSFDGRKYVASKCMVEVPKWERGSGGSWQMITCKEWQRRLEKDSTTEERK